MPKYAFNLSISKDEWLRVYRGYSRFVWCRAIDGTSLKIPVKHFLPFVASDGVHGSFLLNLGQNNKFLSLERLNN